MTALTRRSALAAFLGAVPMVATAARVTVAHAADPFPAAIRRAQIADAAYAESGRVSLAMQAAGLSLSPEWREHRAGLLQDRTSARFELQALTPTTPAAAAALAAYYRDRAAASGDPAAARHAAARRLRKVFRRPGAAPYPVAFEGAPA